MITLFLRTVIKQGICLSFLLSFFFFFILDFGNPESSFTCLMEGTEVQFFGLIALANCHHHVNSLHVVGILLNKTRRQKNNYIEACKA